MSCTSFLGIKCLYQANRPKWKDIMITKKFGINFDSSGGALTLPSNYVSEGEDGKTHENGWTISGYINEDYYFWVNKFEAVHPELGKVWGILKTKFMQIQKKVIKTSMRIFLLTSGITKIFS